MPNFLARLVKRTLGLMPTVKPLLAPLFAPGRTKRRDSLRSLQSDRALEVLLRQRSLPSEILEPFELAAEGEQSARSEDFLGSHPNLRGTEDGSEQNAFSLVERLREQRNLGLYHQLSDQEGQQFSLLEPRIDRTSPRLVESPKISPAEPVQSAFGELPSSQPDLPQRLEQVRSLEESLPSINQASDQASDQVSPRSAETPQTSPSTSISNLASRTVQNALEELPRLQADFPLVQPQRLEQVRSLEEPLPSIDQAFPRSANTPQTSPSTSISNLTNQAVQNAFEEVQPNLPLVQPQRLEQVRSLKDPLSSVEPEQNQASPRLIESSETLTSELTSSLVESFIDDSELIQHDFLENTINDSAIEISNKASPNISKSTDETFTQTQIQAESFQPLTSEISSLDVEKSRNERRDSQNSEVTQTTPIAPENQQNSSQSTVAQPKFSHSLPLVRSAIRSTPKEPQFTKTAEQLPSNHLTRSQRNLSPNISINADDISDSTNSTPLFETESNSPAFTSTIPEQANLSADEPFDPNSPRFYLRANPTASNVLAEVKPRLDLQPITQLPTALNRMSQTSTIENSRATQNTTPQKNNTQPDSENESTIQITIGRVVVRGVSAPPSAPQPRPTAAQKESRLSLEDYLKQREGG